MRLSWVCVFALLASPAAPAQPRDCCRQAGPREAAPGGGLVPALAGAAERARERWSAVITIEGPPDFRARVERDLAALAGTATGRRLLAALEAAGKPVTVWRGSADQCAPLDMAAGVAARARVILGRVVIDAPGAGSGSRVELDDRVEPCYPGTTTLGHELIHALHFATGRNVGRFDYRRIEPGTRDHEEAWTIGLGAYADEPLTDNALRRELRSEALPQRRSHTNECAAPAPAPRVDRPLGEDPQDPAPAPPAGAPRISEQPGLELHPVYRRGETLNVGVGVRFEAPTLFRLGIRVLAPDGAVMFRSAPHAGTSLGVGSTVSFTLPADAPLGGYRLVAVCEVTGRPPSSCEGRFQVR